MQLRKTHNYKNFEFIILVELNVKVERALDGARYHKVSINNSGHNNYYQVVNDVTDVTLNEVILKLINDAEAYVDGNTDKKYTPIQKGLLDMGFEEV